MLANGGQVSKSSDRIRCYGTVDELNCHFGLMGDILPEIGPLEAISNQIFQIQNELFDVGSELALAKPTSSTLDSASVERIENEIDEHSSHLAPLRNFILPGGHPAISQAHICRSVCRRAERDLWTLDEEVRPEMARYLNRLSDWCFTVARRIAFELKIPEKTWQPEKKPK